MHTLKAENIFDASVRQDNNAPTRVQPASDQPVPPQTTARPNNSSSSDKHHGSQTRQTEQIAGWVKPHIKSEVKRIERLHGWSQSKTVATLVEIGLEHNLGEQMWVRISAKIEDAVNKAVQKYSNREAKLAVKGFLAADQARIISIQTLRYILTLGQGGLGDLPHIIEDSQNLAWANLKQSLREEQRP